jgi:hypothetical protein
MAIRKTPQKKKGILKKLTKIMQLANDTQQEIEKLDETNGLPEDWWEFKIRFPGFAFVKQYEEEMLRRLEVINGIKATAFDKIAEILG